MRKPYHLINYYQSSRKKRLIIRNEDQKNDSYIYCINNLKNKKLWILQFCFSKETLIKFVAM